MLGQWKNYDELEESLSMPELLATAEAGREQRHTERKFHAALQGVDLDAEDENKTEEIKKRGIRRAQLEGEGFNPETIMNQEFLEFGQAYHVE